MKIQFNRFSFWIGFYDAWPSLRLGTNYWCFELCIGKLYFERKLDFWNPRQSGGWIITRTLLGTRSIHAKHYRPYTRQKFPNELILF